MENYKKERCTKEHLKINLGQDNPVDDIFMLANPMTYGDQTTPTSPHSGNSTTPRSTTTISNPNTPTISHSSGFSRTFERLSLKYRAKKIFGRNQSSTSGNGSVSQGTGIGGGGYVPIRKTGDDHEDYGGDASSGSDHEDPFSPHSTSSGEILRINRNLSEPPKSPPSNAEHYTTRPHSGGYYARDSGFSSERESVSHMKEEREIVGNTYTDDVRVSPSDSEESRLPGMDALEILHNQLQLLVKQDCDEDTDSVSIYEQTIANLCQQLEEQSVVVDTLKESESNLQLSLWHAEQRTLEVETKLIQRCLRAEKKCSSVFSRYKSLRKKYMELERSHQNCSQLSKANLHRSPRSSLKQQSSNSTIDAQPTHASHHPTLSSSSISSSTSRIPPQRVQSQTLFDRQNKTTEQTTIPTKRPSTAQGFHHDQDSNGAAISSLSHTETCV